MKEMLKKNKPDLLCLIETKVSGDKADNICPKLGFHSWLQVETVLVGEFGRCKRTLCWLRK